MAVGGRKEAARRSQAKSKIEHVERGGEGRGGKGRGYVCHFLDTLMYALNKALIQQSLPISNAETAITSFLLSSPLTCTYIRI